MSKEDIIETIKDFDHYSNNEFKTFLGDTIPCKWYSHKKNKRFKIMVFEDDMVYECESDLGCIGTNLSSYSMLNERYKSSTRNS
jgi:hypothetical protein